MYYRAAADMTLSVKDLQECNIVMLKGYVKMHSLLSYHGIIFFYIITYDQIAQRRGVLDIFQFIHFSCV